MTAHSPNLTSNHLIKTKDILKNDPEYLKVILQKILPI